MSQNGASLQVVLQLRQKCFLRRWSQPKANITMANTASLSSFRCQGVRGMGPLAIVKWSKTLEKVPSALSRQEYRVQSLSSSEKSKALILSPARCISLKRLRKRWWFLHSFCPCFALQRRLIPKTGFHLKTFHVFLLLSHCISSLTLYFCAFLGFIWRCFISSFRTLSVTHSGSV